MHAHEVPTHVQAEDRVLPRPPPLPSSLSNTTCCGQQIAGGSLLAQRIPSTVNRP